MHSGWYEEGIDTKGWSKTQHLEAQDRMMVELLNVLPKAIENLAKDKSIFRILDCGCGVGGSSRFLYKHLTAKLKAVGSKCKVEVVGITLSPYQQNRATELTKEAGIAESDVKFLVANALQTPFDNNSFDLVWSLESGEHMPGKFNWLTEIKRILKPGGRFLCACWCHRETQGAGKGPLAHDEKILLGRIAKNYSLPRFVPPSEYKDAAKELGLKGFSDRQTSFTKNVMPFWPAVVKSCLKPMSVIRLILALPFGGMTTVKGAITAYLMMQGFDKGTLEFAAFTVEK